VDGSYFNNPFGLDDPAPGGQTAAEPIPYDAIDQVQVSIAPFDVRQGGFTGAGVNTVTKSGSNQWNGSLYTFGRNETFVGNQVSGNDVVANPELSYYQSGFSVSGPIIENKLFFFLNAELERRDDPGTNFIADQDGNVVAGESRVNAATMDSIREVMSRVYGYETGPYQGFTHQTNNDKILLKLDWNVNENNNVSFRYNFLDATRENPPHPFVFAFNNTQRGPNENSLPFQNTGYKINNELNSFAMEINSRSSNWANRFFASYTIFRDFREPFSAPFPTIEIGEGGSTYTTLGHEPFSIENVLDQDVLQITNNFSYFAGNHVITLGANFELFSFFNFFNIFYHGVVEFPTLIDFFNATDTSFAFGDLIGSGPFKGEEIDVGQFSIYAQDEFLVSEKLNLKFGLRVDFPIYVTEPVDNPFVRSLPLVDENGNPEVVDQSTLPGSDPLFSPRIGFNWDIQGNRSTQLRGGTGIFTGRVPFVWIGNNISNPGTNPNLPAHLQSFFINAMDPEFKWPQVWNTNVAIDQKLPWDMLGTVEFLYGKDINAVFLRNADLPPTSETLPIDGRPFYTASTLSPFTFPPDGGAGVIVIDNTSDGYNYSATVQLRKNFDFGLNTSFSYTYLKAESNLQSTEIARSLWEQNPVQGDPNKPELSDSQFGIRHRVTGVATYSVRWSENWTSHFGLFFEVAEGNRFVGAGGNRYSFTYSGDVNGDGASGNDLIYIPSNSGEIYFDPFVDGNGNTVSADEQWTALNAFIEQDAYLKENRGKIAERFGAVNPWWWNFDFKFMQDFSFLLGSARHTFQLSLDILNVPSLLNSDWGVRQVARVAATSPLTLERFDSDPANSIPDGAPILTFRGADSTNPLTETYIDDPGISSRWQLQLGIRYFFSIL